MVERRPPKAPQRYQPLPAGQTIIVLTDKNQLMPKDLKETGDQTAKTDPDATNSPADNNPQKLKDSKQVKKVATEKGGQCRIMYSIGMLEALLLIEPPSGGGKWPALNEALALIETENIFNVDTNAVTEAIEHRRITPVSIAHGQAAINGQDTELKIYYELKDLHKIFIEGLVADNHGRVDYHQVKTVQTVSMGDVVAEKIMYTNGEDGIDVHGRIIPAIPGIDRPIKLGKNVQWDEEGLKIIATSGGKPTLSNNILSVLPIHEVHGDVNFHTGNISFYGNVIVYGNVESGFKVEAGGDIVIMGYVDAAEVTAGGKLSVKGRVFGNDKGKLISEGDFYATEVEHATLICNGTVTVNEAIMHSRVIAERKIVVENGKGWIVGGKVHAGEEISARVIGSRLSTITDLEVGPVVKSKIADFLKQETEPGTDADNSGEAAVAEFIQAAPTISKTGETEPPAKAAGRIRFKDVMYPGVRLTFSPFKFIIQNELTFGSVTCSEGYLHLLPYR